MAAEWASDRPTYIALGDSISIDEYAGGRGRGGASLLVRNSDDASDFRRGQTSSPYSLS